MRTFKIVSDFLCVFIMSNLMKDKVLSAFAA